MRSFLLTNCELPTIALTTERQYVEVVDGVIAATGPMLQAPKARGWTGEVIDAGGNSVMPGFVDAHAHVVEAGVERLRCDMSRCQTRRDVIDAVALAARDGGHGWIVGRGWDSALFDGKPPSLEELDRVTQSRPAYLNNANGHCAWVNSEALLRAGIQAGTPDPDGGLLGRDDSGALTGMLYESAMNLVNDLIPPLSAHELSQGMRAGEAEMHSFGVTSWQEAIVGPYVQTTDVFSTLREGAESGELRSRVLGALWWPRGAGPEYIEHLAALRDSLPAESRFVCSAVKIMYDGSAATQTAAMRDPYLATESYGITFFSREELIEIVRAADAAGFDVHIHANGDRAVADCLEAIEHSRERNAPRVRRHQIAHLHFLDDSLIERIARANVVAVIQPLWAHRSTKMENLVLPALDKKQVAGVYRFGSLARAGVTLASSSDWPVSTPDPWQAIHVAVQRRHPSGASNEPLLGTERLDLSTALHAATAGGAYATRREHEIGRIEVGKAADLVMLNASVASIGLDELCGVSVNRTFIDGELVYTR